MIHRYLLCLLTLLVCSSLSAQPWKLIHPERTYVFATPDNLPGSTNYDHVIHLDTVYTSGTDTVGENYRVLRYAWDQPGSQCFDYTNQGYSWLGRQYRERPDGTVFLLNDPGDTLRVLTRATQGSSWLLYGPAAGNHFRATVDTVYYAQVLGVWDSVKVIRLQYEDGTGSPLIHNMNAVPIHIGRETGLIQAFSFRDFPSSVPTPILAGMKQPDLGVQIPGPKAIFDFAPGDVFQRRYDESYVSGSGNSFNILGYTQERFLSRYDSPTGDSVIWQVEYKSYSRREDYNPPPNPVITLTGIEDTITCFLTRNMYYGHYSSWEFPGWEENRNLPGQIFTTHNTGTTVSHPALDPSYFGTVADPTQYHGRVQRGLSWIWSYAAGDTCVSQYLVIGSDASGTYAEGLGFVYEYFNNNPSYREQKMICYQKGAETWGTCVDIDLLIATARETAAPGTFTLWPNPAADVLHLRRPTAEPATLTLHSLTGQEVLRLELPLHTEAEITLPVLPAGLHLVTLTTQSGTVLRDKLVIR